MRFNFYKSAPEGYKAMLGLEKYIHDSGLERSLIDLVKLRASLINGCAFCINMHATDLRKIGEPNHRIDLLSAWDEVDVYSEREKAALAWTDALTKVSEGHVPDEVYERIRSHFSDKELSDLTLLVATINAWNRIAISARAEPMVEAHPAAKAS